MNPQTMVHKVNSIALNFQSYGEEKATEKVRDHLIQFWEPRMLRQIAEYVEKGGEGLEKTVLAAVKQIPGRTR